MARKSAPRSDLCLVAVAGDIDEGEVFPLDPEAPNLVGRSSKGIRLMDQLVSVRHAEITYDPYRGFVIKDLDSVTGTWVDDECLKGDDRPIGIGTRLRFGETEFRVERSRRLPGWLRYVALGVVGLALAAAVLFLLQGVRAPAAPELYSDEPIELGGREVFSVAPDPRWLRKRGLHTSDLTIRRVSDYDYNGVSELWLARGDGEREYMVTFDRQGTWIALGDLPAGCIPQDSGADEFPLLECQGQLWVMGESDQYVLVKSEGAVVWYKASADEDQHADKEEPEPGTLGAGAAALKDVPVDVARVVLKSPEKLSKFLAMRNVTEPIHYLICEDAFDGVAAQVLTASGTVQPLTIGCIHELRLEGVISGEPVAVALSGAGHRALIDDVTQFYAGNPDGLFLQGPARGVIERISQTPGVLRGGSKLIGDTHQDSPLPFYNPVAPEPGEPLGSHALDPVDSRFEVAPVARTANLLQPGKASLASLTRPDQGEGCVELQAQVKKFECYGICNFGNPTLLEVWDVGCGDGPTSLISTGFLGGIEDATVGGVQVRAKVESQVGAKGIDVLRVRVTAREATGN